MNAVQGLSTASAFSFPLPVSSAMERVAVAELELNRVYPLFATKLGGSEDSTGMGAALELQAFVAQVRTTHQAALHALRSWSVGRGSIETAAATYQSLAVIIETFTTRAHLDASELD
jgi:hypothetical protein